MEHIEVNANGMLDNHDGLTVEATTKLFDVRQVVYWNRGMEFLRKMKFYE